MEVQQLHQTIEMFEAITKSQTDDYQSLEILKEAYNKLGRREDALRVSKQLANAYANMGQFSQSILEYEGLVQEYPHDQSVKEALAKLETKVGQLGVQNSPGTPPKDDVSKPSSSTPSSSAGPVASPTKPSGTSPEDGDRALMTVLITEKLITKQAADPLLAKLKTLRAASIPKGQTATLMQLVVEEQLFKLDDLLSALSDKSRLPYLPLTNYDVDRDTAMLLPREMCFQYGIIPFDLISRSVLIATSNPYDAGAQKLVKQMLDYNTFWYLASPADINAELRHVHGLDNKSTGGPR